MRVSGSHRPITTHAEATTTPVDITAEGADLGAARDALRALVPEGHRLLHIIVG